MVKLHRWDCVLALVPNPDFWSTPFPKLLIANLLWVISHSFNQLSSEHGSPKAISEGKDVHMTIISSKFPPQVLHIPNYYLDQMHI